jgi:translation initiation factor eIF-2B subunit delta
MGIQVIYTLLGSLSKFLPKVSKVMVGGASVLMNGTLVGRVGTALIGAMAHSYRVPFIVCCETYKFSSKSQLDSVAEN